jgi:tRNA(Arg) A34 adenosine deaminase TadA
MASSLHIEQALLQAKKSYNVMATQYGCILVDNKTGVIVSRGHNRRKGVRSSKLTECPLQG